MKVTAGGWWSLDTPYLCCLVRGRLACFGRSAAADVAAEPQEEDSCGEPADTGSFDLNGDLFHQTMNSTGATKPRVAEEGARATVVGVDYSGRSEAVVDPSTGMFEIVAQLHSSVTISVKLNGEKKAKRFGPYKTMGLGEILDVGELEA